ncbi:hypothetical protein JW933_04425 [candidate division FCPU426 bacterium]|nr:hypothetical protein [candidate division FCPU426 bacterium]
MLLFGAMVFAATVQPGQAEEARDLNALFDGLDATAEQKPPAGAAPDTGIPAGQEERQGVSFSGEHAFEFHAPVIKDHLDFAGYLKSPKLTNELGLELVRGDLKVVSRWNADLIVEAGGERATLLQSTPAENYVQWSTSDFLFKFGYQHFGWGSADRLNPTNHLNPKDYAGDLFAYETLPLLALSATYYPSNALALEVVYAPYEQATTFPFDLTAQIPADLFSPAEIRQEEIPYSLESGVAGLRLSLFSGLDLSVSYIYDFDEYDTPVVRYTGPLQKSLVLLKERIHRFGLDMKTTLDRFGVWLETCYSLTRDPEAVRYDKRNPYLEWTAGLDFHYGPEERFYLNLQYTGTYVFHYDDRFYADYPQGQPEVTRLLLDTDYARQYYSRALLYRIANQSEGWLHGFMLNLEWPLARSKFIPSLTGVYYLPEQYDRREHTRYGSLLLNPKVAYRPFNAFEVALGAYFIYAWHRTPGGDAMEIDWQERLGRMHGDSNVFLEIRYDWAQEVN